MLVAVVHVDHVPQVHGDADVVVVVGVAQGGGDAAAGVEGGGDQSVELVLVEGAVADAGADAGLGVADAGVELGRVGACVDTLGQLGGGAGAEMREEAGADGAVVGGVVVVAAGVAGLAALPFPDGQGGAAGGGLGEGRVGGRGGCGGGGLRLLGHGDLGFRSWGVMVALNSRFGKPGCSPEADAPDAAAEGDVKRTKCRCGASR